LPIDQIPPTRATSVPAMSSVPYGPTGTEVRQRLVDLRDARRPSAGVQLGASKASIRLATNEAVADDDADFAEPFRQLEEVARRLVARLRRADDPGSHDVRRAEEVMAEHARRPAPLARRTR
jgi:hypothetical protein